MTDWHCINGCKEAADCRRREQDRDGSCVYEYDPTHYKPEHQWKGEGATPRRWTALDGTVVYRCFADYCDWAMLTGRGARER